MDFKSHKRINWHLRASRCFVLIALLATSVSLRGQNDFIEVTTQQNITHLFGEGTIGGGVSFADFDGDGWDDLTFATTADQNIHFYRNNQGIFERIELGFESGCESKQVSWIDYDNDGDKDFFFNCKTGALKLYQNDGQLNFTEVGANIGLTTPDDALTFGANWADFDRDGWLDLYVTFYSQSVNRLFRNVNGESFEEITDESGVSPTQKPTFCGQVFDYDNDMWPDIYLANDRSTRNDLIRNVNGSVFQDVSEASKSNLPMDAMGTTLLDMNYDGYFEVYISNSPAGNALLFNNGNGTFEDIARTSGTIFESVGWGVNAFDFDNDTHTDIYVSGSNVGANTMSSALYRAVNESSFMLTQYEGMVGDTLRSLGNAVGDINNDGLMDIAVNNTLSLRSQLWQNQCPTDNFWLKVELEGTLSNRDGIGAKVAVYTDDKTLYHYRTAGTSFMGQNASYGHFGLSSDVSPDSVKVFWPSGVVDKITDVPVNQKIKLVEGQNQKPIEIISVANLSSTLCGLSEVDLELEVYGNDIEVAWSNGMTGKKITVTESGELSATITSKTHQVISETVNLLFSDLPQVTAETQPATPTESGRIEITEIGGPYTYEWAHDPQADGRILENLSEGTYRVTITNEHGCRLIKEYTVELITGIEDELVKQIEIRYSGNTIEVNLPGTLSPKLKSWRVYDFNGRVIQRSIGQSNNTETITIKGVRTNQLVFIDLMFTDGRVVKKHISLD